jgi:hypothetical protein
MLPAHAGGRRLRRVDWIVAAVLTTEIIAGADFTTSHATAVDPKLASDLDARYRRFAVLPDRLRAPGGPSCKRSLCPTRLVAHRLPGSEQPAS